MKGYIRFVCALLFLTLLVSSFSVICMADSMLLESTNACQDKKIYSNVTLEQEFADNRVLIVLDKAISKANKEHSKDLFSTVDVKKIVDLSKVDENYSIRNEDARSLSSSTGEHKLLNTDSFRQILLLELPTNSKSEVLKAIKKLEQIDGVVYAGPDYTTYSASIVPNDPKFSQLWGLSKIQAPDTWEITVGSSDVYVGVIDTGIANHPDLTSNLVGGWDFVNNNAYANDDRSGHGTHVAGTIAASGNNGIGVAGVSWCVKLVPLQVSIDEQGDGDTSDAIEAIHYAINNNIPILNYSRYDLYYSYAFEQAVANYNGLFICSAGNKEINVDIEMAYPASYNLSNMISVANTNFSDQLFVFVDVNGNHHGSNYGANTVHLAAPGTSIYSCYIDADKDGDYDYEQLDGTSMAAPHVTGVAALIKSIRPDLSAYEIKELILNNVDPVEALSGKCITGGRLNAYKAVRAATKPQTFTGDVNGDGRSDIILSRKINSKRALTVYLGNIDGSFREPITTQFSNNFVYSDLAFTGDFNGDGLCDVVVHWRSSSNSRNLLVYTSKGDGTFNTGANLNSTRYHDPVAFPCSLLVDDINGDGKDDFIVHYRNNTNGYRYALVYKGTATSPYFIDATTNALASTDTYRSNEPVYTGDFNGDGYGDMLVQWVSGGKRQLRVYTGKSNGTFNAGANLSSTRAHDPATYQSKAFVSDVNGDGMCDFTVLWKNGTGYRNFLVYKGSNSSPYTIDASTSALSTSDYYSNTEIVKTGDINGDGRTDIIIQGRTSNGKRCFRTYTANANGSYNAGVLCNTTNSSGQSRYAETYLIADINNDGRDDYIALWKNDNDEINLYTYLGTAQGTFTAAVVSYHNTKIPHFNY